MPSLPHPTLRWVYTPRSLTYRARVQCRQASPRHPLGFRVSEQAQGLTREVTPARPAEPRQGPVPVSSPSHARRVPPHLGHTSSFLSVSPVLPSPTGPARGNSVSLLLSPTSSLLAPCSITPDISVSPFNMLPCGRYRSEDADHRHADGSLTTASLIIRCGARSPDAQPCREGERLRRQKLCRGLRAAYPETIFRDRVRHVMGMWDRGGRDGPLHGQDRGEPQARAQPRPRV